MNIKGRKIKNQEENNNSIANVISQEELKCRIDQIESKMKASTWKNLETNGKFTKNDKPTFVSDDKENRGRFQCRLVKLADG